MAYRLPPFHTLRAFEAAGRHLSFKQAAEELNLTPSAISHGIQDLEEWLGVALFVRDKRGLALTESGTAYLPQVRQALDLLAQATENLPGRGPRRALSISAAPTFAARWLIPRLAAFQKRHPEVVVSVDTSHRPVEFPRDGTDLAIRMGRGAWPNLYALKLVTEDLVPVCAPRLAARIGTREDLMRATLLHVTKASEDWEAWLRLKGWSGFDLKGGVRFDTIQMALEAAGEGLGVALGRWPLVQADIESGRLVPVLGPPVTGQTSYWLVTDKDALSRPEVAAFRDWIRSELETSAVSS